MSRFLLVLAAVVTASMAWGLVLSAQSLPSSRPTSRPSTQEIKALVGELSAEDFRTRQAAQEALAAAGPGALDALMGAAKSSDAEIRDRAQAIIREIRSRRTIEKDTESAKFWRWSYPITHGPTGAPVFSGEKALAMGTDWRLHAVDCKTGNKLWAVDLPFKMNGQLAANDKVVAVTQLTTLHVFEVSNGRKLWSKDLRIALPDPSTAPAASGPASKPDAAAKRLASARLRGQIWLSDDYVLVRTDSKLRTLKASTGDSIWQMDVGSEGNHSNLVVRDGVAYLSKGSFVAAIDLATQKELWSQEPAGCSSLSLAGKTLCCTAGPNLVALNAENGQKLWSVDLAAELLVANKSYNRNGLQTDGEKVFVLFGAELLAYDAKTGEKSSLSLDLCLGVPDDGGVAASSPASGPQMGAQVVNVTVAGTTAYIGTMEGLFAFDVKTGKRLWCLPVCHAIVGEPVARGQVLYLAVHDGDLGALVEKSSSSAEELPKDRPGLHALDLPLLLSSTRSQTNR